MRCVFAGGILLALLVCPASVLPDAKLGYTFGPGDYNQYVINSSFRMSPTGTLSLNYSLIHIDQTTTIQSYDGGMDFNVNPYSYSNVHGIVSPEVNNYGFYGVGARGGYKSKARGLAVDAALGFDHYVHLQRVNEFIDAGTTTVVMPLYQDALRPAVIFTLNDRYVLRVSYSYYFYDKSVIDLARSGFRFLRNLDIQGVIALVTGFPEYSVSFGTSYFPKPELELAFDYTEIFLVIRRFYARSGLLYANYKFRKYWSFNVSYNFFDTGASFYHVGIGYYW